jgi:hypothetical protein
MQMNAEGFVRQDRGPYLFDRWQWPKRVPTQLGDLLVELTTSDGEPPPDTAMAAAATELAEFASANGDLLLDLIYGHYKYAEENGSPSGASAGGSDTTASCRRSGQSRWPFAGATTGGRMPACSSTHDGIRSTSWT